MIYSNFQNQQSVLPQVNMLQVQNENYNKSLNLLNKFLFFNVQATDYLSQSQYKYILKVILGHEFDESILEQIFEQCLLNQKTQVLQNTNISQPQVRVQDFIEILLDAEKRLYQKAMHTQSAIQEYQIQKQQSEEIVRSTQNIKKNNYGIDLDSAVTVTVLEGIELYDEQGPNEVPFVQIQVGKNIQKTTGNVNISKIDGLNVFQWGQSLVFPVEMGSEEIYVDVFSFDTALNQNFVIGKFSIELKELQSQNQVDQEYTLYNNLGIAQNQKKLKLSIQYIFDKQLYNEQIYERISTYLEELNSDVIDFNSDLEIIKELYIAQIPANVNPYDVQIQLQEAREELEKEQTKHISQDIWVVYFLSLGFVGVALLKNLTFYGMLDLILSIFILKGFWLNYFDLVNLKSNMYCLVLGSIFDVLNLMIYNSGLWDEKDRVYLTQIQGSSSGQFVWSILMVWISLFYKIVLFLALNYVKYIYNRDQQYAFGYDVFSSEGIHNNPFIVRDLRYFDRMRQKKQQMKMMQQSQVIQGYYQKQQQALMVSQNAGYKNNNNINNNSNINGQNQQNLQRSYQGSFY